MGKKVLLVAIILVIAASVLFASTGSIGIVNYYSYANFFGDDPDYEAYVPGLRTDWYLADWLGLSGDFIYLGPDAWYSLRKFGVFTDEIEYANVFVNVVARAQLGVLEPYVGAGPGYMIAFTEDDYENLGSVSMNVRGGLDVNLLESFSIGAEVNIFVDDLREFFGDIEYYTSEEYLQERSLVGITCKLKF